MRDWTAVVAKPRGPSGGGPSQRGDGNPDLAIVLVVLLVATLLIAMGVIASKKGGKR